MVRAWHGRFGAGIWLLSACTVLGCSEQARLSVSGDTPYARCLAREVDDAEARVGGVSVAIDQGVLSIAGLPSAPTLAVFSGPGPGPAPWPAPDAKGALRSPALAALAALKPSLVLVLGDLGDDAGVARATAAGLDRLGVPVLVLGGGRDSVASLRAADALPNVIDISPLRAVRLAPAAAKAGYTLVPVAGALDGRYARGPEACGYAEDDLSARALAEPAPGERRLLAAWQAPARPRPGDGGSPPLAALAQRIGAHAGLYAWPEAQAGRAQSTRDGRELSRGVAAEDLSLIVPRLGGPPLERADGSRLSSGAALLELGSAGPVLRDLAHIALR